MKITELTIYTDNFTEQISFYTQVLNFKITQKTNNSISFKTGKSSLQLIEKKGAKSYHFAFNILTNKIDEAHAWLQKRVELLSSDTKEIVRIEDWDANSLYFYDKNHNILEFIARNSLPNPSNEPFSSEAIISISEIGMPVKNIESIFNQLNALKEIPIYDGNFERFCAIGNEEGLFILINKEIKKWFPPMDEAYTEDFIIKGDYNFKFIDGEIKKLD